MAASAGAAPNAQVELIRGLLRVLLTEEELLTTLVELGNAQQYTLIKSDFSGLEQVSEQLMAVAEALPSLQAERDQLLDDLGVGHLKEAVDLAETLGEHALSGVRDRLLLGAHRFKAVQERNAELILNASKLRERWVNMLAGMAGGTYDAGGKSEQEQGRRIVSRSA